MAIFYKYRVDGIVKAPAEVAGAVCKKIIDEDGAVTPEKLVDVSRPEDAPLHNEFEWNDAFAAEKYRCEQARQIIKNVVIIETSSEEVRETKSAFVYNSDRAFVSNGECKHEYVTLKDALSNNRWRDNLLMDARKDMLAFKSKYYRLTELANVFKSIDDFLSA